MLTAGKADSMSLSEWHEWTVGDRDLSSLTYSLVTLVTARLFGQTMQMRLMHETTILPPLSDPSFLL